MKNFHGDAMTYWGVTSSRSPGVYRTAYVESGILFGTEHFTVTDGRFTIEQRARKYSGVPPIFEMPNCV